MLEGALFAHFLLEFRRLAVYPGLAFGGEWVGARAQAEASDGELRRNYGNVRLDLYTTAAVKVTEQFAVELNIAGGFAFASRKVSVDAGERELPEDPEGWLFGGVGIQYDLVFGDD